MFSQFINAEDGARVVEYALIIALVSVALVLALDPLTIGTSFEGVMGWVGPRMTTGPCA